MQTENRHIAKSSSYGTFIDFPFITTDSIVEGRKVIVGALADYIERLENICAKHEDMSPKLAVQDIIKDDEERLHAYDTVFSRIYTNLLLSPNPLDAEQEIYGMARNLEMGNYLCEQKDQKIAELEKAFELACDELYTKSGLEDCRDCPAVNNCSINDCKSCFETISKYFKSKAKQELKPKTEDEDE